MKVKGRRTGHCYAGTGRTVKRAWCAGRIVVLCVAACLLMSSCQGVRKEEEKKSIRIGISLYRGDDTFINNIRSIIEEKAKEYERESGIKVTLDIQEAKGSQNTQNNQVERFIALGCDVLCINPVDRMDTSLIIDKAMTAGVPVVFFNRQPVEEDMNRWDKLFYVGVDAKETAVLQGKMVVDLYRKQPEAVDLNGDGVVSYVMLEGESSHQDSLIRTEWSVQTLKDGAVPIEKITGGIANWERSQASALMEQWLIEYPDTIELVISNNDDMALGAIDALERAQTEGGECDRHRRHHAGTGGSGKRKTAGVGLRQQGDLLQRRSGTGCQLCAGGSAAGGISLDGRHLFLDAAGDFNYNNQRKSITIPKKSYGKRTENPIQ